MVMFDPEDLADEAAARPTWFGWRRHRLDDDYWPEESAEEPDEDLNWANAPCVHCGALVEVFEAFTGDPACPSCRRGYPEL